MPFASITLGAEQPILNSELLGYVRDPLVPIKDAVTADSDVVAPIDRETFGFWLMVSFGATTAIGRSTCDHCRRNVAPVQQEALADDPAVAVDISSTGGERLACNQRGLRCGRCPRRGV